MEPEFNKFAKSYEELLRDPIRDGFASNSLFFHVRKSELIRAHFRNRGMNTHKLSYLDLGCGKGELLQLLAGEFNETAGCDPSPGMLESIPGAATRVQLDPFTVPFEDARFDFVTAVCVYHHIPPEKRPRVTSEAYRVTNPGGTFCIVEHNPYNPATQIITRRAPVDVDAILLRAREVKGLLTGAGFEILGCTYFLYLPERLYRKWERIEDLLGSIPIGGQYAVFARRPAP